MAEDKEGSGPGVTNFAAERLRRLPPERLTDAELAERRLDAEKAIAEMGREVPSEEQEMDESGGIPDLHVVKKPIDPKVLKIFGPLFDDLEALAKERSASAPDAKVTKLPTGRPHKGKNLKPDPK